MSGIAKSKPTRRKLVALTKWDRRTRLYREYIADLERRGIIERVLVTDFGTQKLGPSDNG